MGGMADFERAERHGGRGGGAAGAAEWEVAPARWNGCATMRDEAMRRVGDEFYFLPLPHMYLFGSLALWALWSS